MSRPLLIVLLVELLMAAALSRMGQPDQPAALEWQRHPTVETRKACAHEKLATECGRWLFGCGLFVFFSGTTIFLYWVSEGVALTLILKRVGTSLALFISLFPVLVVGSISVELGVARTRAGSGHLDSGRKPAEFDAEAASGPAAIIFVAATWLSALASTAVAYAGIFPWCRERSRPPLTAPVAANGMTEPSAVPNGAPETPVCDPATQPGPPPVIERIPPRRSRNWVARHFRRYLERPPWDFCWRIGLESTVVSLLVAIPLVAVFDEPRRTLLDLPLPAAFFLLLVLAPPVETLIFQAFPIFLVRVCKGSFGLQILVSTLLFAAAHLSEGVITGIAAGLIGGLYFAFAYAHWRTKSGWYAPWVTAGAHAIHNGIVFILLVIGGNWK